MERLLRLVQQYIHPCLHCGSLFKSEGLLCHPCQKKLESYLCSQDSPKDFGVFDAHYLFRWTPGKSNLLSAQLVGLKGEHSQKDWRHWATHFWVARVQSGFPQRRVIVVPAPSKNGGKDHAYQWAESLAIAAGGEVHSCLRKRSTQHQRGANRDQRVAVELELDENSSLVSDFWSEALWVFADDIVTTGSTALAAYQALGSPPHFEVWALAYRSLACGD